MDEETIRKEFEEWAKENLELNREYEALDLRIHNGRFIARDARELYAAWLEATRRADEKNALRIGELEAALTEIALYAHDNSTGPAVPDHLWEIRRIAYDAL